MERWAVDIPRGRRYFRGEAMSKVILIHVPGIRRTAELSQARVASLYKKAFSLLSLDSGPTGPMFSTKDRVGIKINTLGGKRISTRREISEGLAAHLSSTVPPERSPSGIGPTKN